VTLKWGDYQSLKSMIMANIPIMINTIKNPYPIRSGYTNRTIGTNIRPKKDKIL
jgi:hypothetical protein